MSEYISPFFVNPAELPEDGYGLIQMTFLMSIYIYILALAADMISDGSELLLLIPKYEGIVGPVVLPVLGVVPDGMMVLFSGFGADVMNRIAVGVGALAGSTIFLLTAPWVVAFMAGRVSRGADGNPDYSRSPKLDPNRRWTNVGISFSKDVTISGKIMIMTMLPYVLVQIPALGMGCAFASSPSCDGTKQTWFALAAFILCCIGLVSYLAYQVWNSTMTRREQQMYLIFNAVEKQLITFEDALMKLYVVGQLTKEDAPESYHNLVTTTRNKKDFEKFLNRMFDKFHSRADSERRNRKYDEDVLHPADVINMLKYMRVQVEESPRIIDAMDTDKDGVIHRWEFLKYMMDLAEDVSAGAVITSDTTHTSTGSYRKESGEDTMEEQKLTNLIEEKGPALHRRMSWYISESSRGVGNDSDEEGDFDEDEEDQPDIPDSIANLSTPQERMDAIFWEACKKMIGGTMLVLLFTDPCVDIFTEMGLRVGLNPFFISFIFAPIASNASELVATYAYAKKKTRKSISVSLSLLFGAGNMNNTYCLGVFLMIIMVRQLPWVFTAETTAIIVVELIAAILAFRTTQGWWETACMGMLYPLSLVIVAGLESYGID
mmetsp:Transcript_9905/g.15937  ORF Transcript_9905/g.15937 Transcript_9905/m.15937 type:complete len:604 (+) Transcript_9905:75-1886(+)